MRIAQLQIRNFRGIRELDWAPVKGVNCLIGPGDSAKTTVLDAIEIALNPRYAFVGDDADFFDLKIENELSIFVTLVDLPKEVLDDARYGMYLRGWDAKNQIIEDELGDRLEDALTVRFSIDRNSLEGSWHVFKTSAPEDDKDPPQLRLKDGQRFSATRLGPYADRHLSWGRNSVLTKLGDKGESLNGHLAQASRAAREAFRAEGRQVFGEATKNAERLSKLFGVSVRKSFTAELDVEGSSLSSGGITLHDDRLPLRTLGTGSSRLLVAGLQQGARGSRISLVDEIEHGLEPHRIARLIVHMRTALKNEHSDGAEACVEIIAPPQVFATTHSPVVVRELNATEVFVVRRHLNGAVVINSAGNTDRMQSHLRRVPDAFMARRILLGEGKTEVGFMRGLDKCWTAQARESFALRGVIPVSGGGSETVPLAICLRDLGYEVMVLLDSDAGPKGQKVHKQELVDEAKEKGCQIEILPNRCAIEHRLFLDIPWAQVQALVQYALQRSDKGEESLLATINHAREKEKLSALQNLSLPSTLDAEVFRRLLGNVANAKSWFKDIDLGEDVAEIVFPSLDAIADTPLAKTITQIRSWIDV